ncbi:MAG: 16S rRNA (cytidine(1402)-2'-O)-methyltransferase [Ignavibacteriae bacterium]|nr:16S rRNA (cytidine(1402)-2'-O)-methyltransferase [Ignavibacteriota bacterium]
MPGTLYLVATPIGNLEDISFRALRILKEVDLVVYEERKAGSAMLRHFGIEKPVESLNEHNEAAASSILLSALKKGSNVAVVSDAGTPVFSDPGQILVRKAIDAGVKIVPVPGATSLMPALISSGFPIERFVFAGFLSPKRNRRIVELQELKKEKRTIVLMDTPYRLLALMRDIADVLGSSRRLSVAFDLTMPTEEIFRGTAQSLLQKFSKDERKGVFVIVVEGV